MTDASPNACDTGLRRKEAIASVRLLRLILSEQSPVWLRQLSLTLHKGLHFFQGHLAVVVCIDTVEDTLVNGDYFLER